MLKALGLRAGESIKIIPKIKRLPRVIILKRVTVLTLRKQGQPLVSNNSTHLEPKKAAACEQYSNNSEMKKAAARKQYRTNPELFLSYTRDCSCIKTLNFFALQFFVSLMCHIKSVLSVCVPSIDFVVAFSEHYLFIHFPYAVPKLLCVQKVNHRGRMIWLVFQS